MQNCNCIYSILAGHLNFNPFKSAGTFSGKMQFLLLLRSRESRNWTFPESKPAEEKNSLGQKVRV